MLVDGNNPVVRFAYGLVILPIVAIVLYGSARIAAMILVRIIPDGPLKRRLFTDTETGRLAYTPKVRGDGLRDKSALSRRDLGEDGP